MTDDERFLDATELDSLLERDDVATSDETIELDAGEFETVRENVRRGFDRWVGALVRDDEGRVAMVRNRWSDGWVLPGGNVEPGETLCEAVVRELREETELDARVERPLEVVEQTFVRDGGVALDASTNVDLDAVSGHFVVFEARVSDPTLGDDLGVDATEIRAARWFDAVPEDARDPDLIERHR